MTDTINNNIPEVPENTIDPAAGLNLSLNTIDALLQVLVQTVGANTPPVGVEGQRHIVGTAPSGPWAGQANRMARFLDGAYQFFDARYALNAADGLWYVRSASTWAPLAGGGGGEANTASNLGAGEGIYASKVGVDLRFKSLVAGTNVSLSSDGNTVTIDATGGGGGMTNPMTAAGDVIVGGASGAPARLAIGTEGQVPVVRSGALVYEAQAGGTVPFAPVVADATTARTLVITDAGNYLRFTNSAATVCTVAPQASVAWAAYTEVHVRRVGAGNLTLTPGAGVTLNAPSGGTLVLTAGMSVTLKRVTADEWDVIGQTVAV